MSSFDSLPADLHRLIVSNLREEVATRLALSSSFWLKSVWTDFVPARLDVSRVWNLARASRERHGLEYDWQMQYPIVSNILQKLLKDETKTSTLVSLHADDAQMLYVADLVFELAQKLFSQLVSLRLYANIATAKLQPLLSRLLELFSAGTTRLRSFGIHVMDSSFKAKDWVTQLLSLLRDGAAPELVRLDCHLQYFGAGHPIPDDIFHLVIDTVAALSKKKLKQTTIGPSTWSLRMQLAKYLQIELASTPLQEIRDIFELRFGLPFHAVRFDPQPTFTTFPYSVRYQQMEDLFALCFPPIDSLPSRAEKESAVFSIVKDLSNAHYTSTWMIRKVLSVLEYYKFPQEHALWWKDPLADPAVHLALCADVSDDSSPGCYDLLEALILQDSRHLVTLSQQSLYSTELIGQLIPRLLRKIGSAAKLDLSPFLVNLACENFWMKTIETTTTQSDTLEAIDLAARSYVKFFPAVPERVRKFSRKEESAFLNETTDLEDIRAAIRKVLISSRG